MNAVKADARELNPAKEEIRPLAISFIAALCLFLFSALALSRKTGAPALPVAQSMPIEAVIFEQPKDEPHLAQVHPAVHEAAHVEQKMSLAPSASAHEASHAPVAEESNKIEASQGEVQTHGPQLIHSVAPKLPSYLKDENLHASVLIEFLIGADGKVVPHLIKTSGNEELDVLALKSAREWTFLPAKDAGHAVDANVRLRINFAVD